MHQETTSRRRPATLATAGAVEEPRLAAMAGLDQANASRNGGSRSASGSRRRADDIEKILG
jgi:hypothetical protein